MIGHVSLREIGSAEMSASDKLRLVRPLRPRAGLVLFMALSAAVLGLVACGAAPVGGSPAPPQTTVAIPVEAPPPPPPAASSALVVPAVEVPVDPLTDTIFERTLRDWQVASGCTSYDYHPDGGIQNFWCHRPASLSLVSIRKAAGMDIFVAGPHVGDALSLGERYDFGRYNPAFVRWLVDNASPAPRGSQAQQRTQSAYDQHMRPLATIFWQTYRKAKSEGACFSKERAAYEKGIQTRKLPEQYYERWYYFMNPAFCSRVDKPNAEAYLINHGGDGGFNGNVVKTAVGFWLRRSMDGTMDTFAEGLRKLISIYQPELFASER